MANAARGARAADAETLPPSRPSAGRGAPGFQVPGLDAA
jgi:hypothetical protein